MSLPKLAFLAFVVAPVATPAFALPDTGWVPLNPVQTTLVPRLLGRGGDNVRIANDEHGALAEATNECDFAMQMYQRQAPHARILEYRAYVTEATDGGSGRYYYKRNCDIRVAR